ncbi:hypothetical protein HOC37_02490 [bacterium]|jgi:hypothetical protein|nr:hypothetical protein [bacterium]
MNKNIAIDIDGCLTEYPSSFLNWIANEKGSQYKSLEIIKKVLSKKDYQLLKHEYRLSGAKRSIPLLVDAKEVLDNLNKKGFSLWIVTSRPEWEPVSSDTKHWLKRNKIPYEKLIFTKNKKNFFLQQGVKYFRAIIDDDISIIKLLAEKNTTTRLFHFQNHLPELKLKKGIIQVNNWKSIEKQIE